MAHHAESGQSGHLGQKKLWGEELTLRAASRVYGRWIRVHRSNSEDPLDIYRSICFKSLCIDSVQYWESTDYEMGRFRA